MRGQIFILILLILSCSTPKDKITVPKLHAEFYTEALDRINKELESDPENTGLIDQKLFYCDQMGWPNTCISALDAYKKMYGMSGQLIDQYVTYYLKHERYQSLLDLIENWDAEFNLKSNLNQTYIECLTRLDKNIRAKVELRRYLISHQSEEDLCFASTQYLRMNDSLMAAYNLSKLYKKDPESELMWTYGNILVQLGYTTEGFNVMSSYVEKNEMNQDIQVAYARLQAASGGRKEARKRLLPFITQDTIAYLLADWYQEDLLWDSAAVVLKEQVRIDSTSREPLWRLGNLYEERGWFTTSLSYFENLHELNSQDTLVQQKIDQIQRKIAYLQRLKFEENKIPVIELEPIKN